MTEGRFIVFEGLDASGTTTQASLLSERLIESGRRVYLTSEPSFGPVGQTIRMFLSGRVTLPAERGARDELFAHLFAADRADHLNDPVTGILERLRQGTDVICTRYVLSSLAYNAATAEEEAFVRNLNGRFREPDYLFYLDCPVDLSLSRIERARAVRDSYETRTELQKVYSNYSRLVTEYQGAKLVIPANLPKLEILRLCLEGLA
jgi:dTMP kinase